MARSLCTSMGPITPSLFGTFFPNPPRHLACKHSNLPINSRVCLLPMYGGRASVELCFVHSGLADFALLTGQTLELHFLFGTFIPFLTYSVNEQMLPNTTWVCLRRFVLEAVSLTVLCDCCCLCLPMVGLCLPVPPERAWDGCKSDFG